MRPEPQPDMVWLLFSPSGRISGLTFFKSLVLWMALFGVVTMQMIANREDSVSLGLWSLVFIVLMLVWILSAIMLSIKRLHDAGWSGPWVLLLFLPVVGFLALLALVLMGSDGPNDFGAQSDRPARNWGIRT